MEPPDLDYHEIPRQGWRGFVFVHFAWFGPFVVKRMRVAAQPTLPAQAVVALQETPKLI
jgi:hypothetical protein